MSNSEKKPVVATDAAPAVKVSPKPAAKPSAPATASKKVTKAPAKAPKPVRAAADAKPVKPPKASKEKKVKMVRDSFTFPKPEFEVLATLKLRAAKLETPVKKTELIRAGIKALAGMSDAVFVATVRSVPNLKTGRPAKTA